MKRYAPIQVNEWGKEVDYNFFPDAASLEDARARGTDLHSIWGDPLFIDPVHGDFSIAENSPALTIGFKNFPMNEFGVQSPSLRKMAMRPQIPLLITDMKLDDKSAIVGFLGGKIKSVDGLGDRSAYGLPDEKGVIIISAPESSILFQSGLQNKDVILTADDKPVADIKSLMDLYQEQSWRGKIILGIMRGQQAEQIELKSK